MEKVLSSILSHLRFSLNLNNRYMSVKGTAGIASLGCFGVFVYQLCAPKTDSKVCLGSLIGVAGFGACYYCLGGKQVGIPSTLLNDEDTSRQCSPSNANVANIKEPIQQHLSEITSAPSSNYDDDQLIGKMLYLEDLCILYSPPGVGKTVLAIQMAVDLSLGRVSKIMPDDNGVHIPQQVLYYDGELDDADYTKIFGLIDRESLNKVEFLRKFYFKTTSQWVADVTKKLSEYHDCNITVVLDNISCICSSVNAETIRELFLYSLKNLQELAGLTGIRLTFIVIAHTNKQLVLAGSSNIANFATTVIGLEEEDDDYVRMTIDKDRKYGEMRHKTFRLLRKETPEGYKYFENLGLIVDEQNDTSIEKCEERLFRGHPESLVKRIYEEKISGIPYRVIADKHGKSHTHWRQVIKDYEDSLNEQEKVDNNSIDDVTTLTEI